MNSSTALRAETKKEENIIFISDAHEKFYYEKLKEVRYQDVYHKALCYCLGISDDTRRNVYKIYDFKTGSVITECLHEGWQTSGSVRVVRMAFNLYCNGTPSVFDYEDAEEQGTERAETYGQNVQKSERVADKSVQRVSLKERLAEMQIRAARGGIEKGMPQKSKGTEVSI